MSGITHIVGTGIPLGGNDIDTDRIVPARFLKELTFDNMGAYFFYDSRFDLHKNPLPHILNDPRYAGGSVLIVGKNFGCGSSREHAAQAMKRFGIQLVIGESFGEIFAGNCKAIGVPVLSVSADRLATLLTSVQTDPLQTIRLDLVAQTLCVGSTFLPYHIPDTWRLAFISDTWDACTLLRQNESLIQKTAARLPYMTGF